MAMQCPNASRFPVFSTTDMRTCLHLTPLLCGSGGGHVDSRLASTVSQAYTAYQSTQAPRMDVSGLCTNSTAISHSTMRSMVRQLNAFSRQDLLLGRFELLGPHHRRQGGVRCSRIAVAGPDSV